MRQRGSRELFPFLPTRQQSLFDLIRTREASINANHDPLGLFVDIANVDTAFVGKEDPVSFANRLNADVVFVGAGVRQEGLDEESAEGAGGLANLWGGRKKKRW